MKPSEKFSKKTLVDFKTVFPNRFLKESMEQYRKKNIEGFLKELLGKFGQDSHKEFLKESPGKFLKQSLQEFMKEILEELLKEWKISKGNPLRYLWSYPGYLIFWRNRWKHFSRNSRIDSWKNPGGISKGNSWKLF